MPETKGMNAILREARGLTLPEPKTKREREKQHEDMNARLRAARGFIVETNTEEESTDA